MAAILLLVTSRPFHTAFDREIPEPLRREGCLPDHRHDGRRRQAIGIFDGCFKDSIKLVPFMAFWLLWPNWGATLYGEVRGAKDFRKNVYPMAGGLLAAVIFGLVF